MQILCILNSAGPQLSLSELQVTSLQDMSDTIYILTDVIEILALGWSDNLDNRKYKYNPPQKKPQKIYLISNLVKLHT